MPAPETHKSGGGRVALFYDRVLYTLSIVRRGNAGGKSQQPVPTRSSPEPAAICLRDLGFVDGTSVAPKVLQH